MNADGESSNSVVDEKVDHEGSDEDSQYDSDEDYCDNWEYIPLDTRYFYSPRFAMLFGTDDFNKRCKNSYQRASDHTGNEAAPEELSYKAYVLALCKIHE